MPPTEKISDRIARIERENRDLKSAIARIESAVERSAKPRKTEGWAQIKATTADANVFDAVMVDIFDKTTAATPTARSASANIEAVTVNGSDSLSVDDIVKVSLEKGIWTVIPTGSSGTTVEATGTDADASTASRTTTFSTTSSQTKSVATGTLTPTSDTIFSTNGYKALVAGTYYAEWNVELLLNATNLSNIGTVDTAVPESPTVPIHLVTTGGFRLRGYVYDSGGAYTSGNLLDEKTAGGLSHLLPSDGFYFSSPSFANNARYHVKVSALFGLSQATIDALTGDAALFYLEGKLDRAAGTSGTATATLITSFNSIYIDSELDSGDLISISVASPP